MIHILYPFQWPYFESASLHYCQVFCFHFPSMDLIQFDSAVAVDFPLDFLKGFFDKHIIGNIFSWVLQKVLWIPDGNSRSKIHKSLGWHKHSTCPSHDKLRGRCKVVARFYCELRMKLYWFCPCLLHLTVIPQWKPIPKNAWENTVGGHFFAIWVQSPVGTLCNQGFCTHCQKSAHLKYFLKLKGKSKPLIKSFVKDWPDETWESLGNSLKAF